MTESLADLQSRLGYQFVDISHLEAALTHRSVGPSHNERLEFLGDSIVTFMSCSGRFTSF